MRNVIRFTINSVFSYNTKKIERLHPSELYLDDLRRIIEPPKIFIDDNSKFKKLPFVISNKSTILDVLETDHGIYIKPTSRLPDGNFENIFGFGCGCIGFTNERLVYYPNYR